MPTFFLCGKHVTGHSSAGAASQGRCGREESLPLAHWQDSCLYSPWMCLDFIITRTHCWLRFNLPPGHLRLFLQSCFAARESQPVLMHGVTLSHAQVFTFVGLHLVSVCHFLQFMVLSVSLPLQHVTHCSSLVPSMDFLWAHSILSAWLLVKMWNNISPSNQLVTSCSWNVSPLPFEHNSPGRFSSTCSLYI